MLAVVWILRRTPVAWPVWSGAVPAYAVGTLATYWFVERVLLDFPA